jgi:hypothetical protein
VFSPTFATASPIPTGPRMRVILQSRFKTSPGVTGALKRAFLIRRIEQSFLVFRTLTLHRTGRARASIIKTPALSFFREMPKKSFHLPNALYANRHLPGS